MAMTGTEAALVVGGVAAAGVIAYTASKRAPLGSCIVPAVTPQGTSGVPMFCSSPPDGSTILAPNPSAWTTTQNACLRTADWLTLVANTNGVAFAPPQGFADAAGFAAKYPYICIAASVPAGATVVAGWTPVVSTVPVPPGVVPTPDPIPQGPPPVPLPVIPPPVVVQAPGCLPSPPPACSPGSMAVPVVDAVSGCITSWSCVLVPPPVQPPTQTQPPPAPGCPHYAATLCGPGYTHGPSTYDNAGCLVPGPCVPISSNPPPTPTPTPVPTPNQNPPPVPTPSSAPPGYSSRPAYWPSLSGPGKLAAQAFYDMQGYWPDMASAQGVYTDIITKCPGISPNCGGRSGLAAVGFEIATAPQRVAVNYITTSASGHTDAASWIDAAYRVLLGRPADSGGMAAWTPVYNGSNGAVNVLLGLTSSGEFQSVVARQAAVA